MPHFLDYYCGFESAHVHNVLSNFQKTDGVGVMMGQLIITVNSIRFLNITVIHYAHVHFIWILVNIFWLLLFLGHQSVRDRTAQAGAPILKILSVGVLSVLFVSVRDRTA